MTTANKLTLLRIVLVPVCMIFLMIDAAWAHWTGWAVFIIASVTDCADGYIARHYNQITNFGKFMDPLADKMLTTAAFLCLMHYGRMSAAALMIILAREFAVSGIRLIAASNGTVIAASWWGKVKTVLEMAAIIVAVPLLDNPIGENASRLITDVLVWAATAAAVLSGLDYIIKNKNLLSEK